MNIAADAAVKALFAPMVLPRGPVVPNRFVLAPLTNCQSNDDGTLNEAEYVWLTQRAEGGFGMVTTCASHVQACGQGFEGQLGCFSDAHLPGLTRLADGLRAAGAISSLQLHHAGNRAVAKDLVGPSDDARSGARAMTGAEVEALTQDFITAAKRAEQAGFDGVQIHGAHGYILAQFLSPTINQRSDQWGGSFENRSRLMLDILAGIRAACRPDFQVGLRISPERFGLDLSEMIELARILLAGGQLDYLDVSLWDIKKLPEDPAFAGQSLMSYFTALPRGDVKLGVAGKIMTAADAAFALAEGADYAAIGRAAILAHDFPLKARVADYESPAVPVAPQSLLQQGLSPVFVKYLQRVFPNFVTS